MQVTWKNAFSQSFFACKDDASFVNELSITDLATLRRFLDFVHIRYGLLRPYFEIPDYPIVESRELLPSFEADMWEYTNLPGFSLVAFERPIQYFQEIFQFDMLHTVDDSMAGHDGPACPLEGNIQSRNIQVLQSRLAKALQEPFRQRFARRDTSQLDNYAAIMPYLLTMDRAQVLSMDRYNQFHLSGVFASFPSDLDSEIKRFGLRIGKFSPRNNVLYEQNRLFVYQFLMELYGFPIVSERRTSSALFARRLHKTGERFMVRVLGQSDRAITTISNIETCGQYPRVDKIALVRVDEDQEEAIKAIGAGGFFIDEEKRVVIMRISYKQHAFNMDNVRQDRALSVERQEIIHPLTGEVLTDLNVVKDTTNMFLRLNDIVRGEYTGRIIYKRTEIVENTDTDEKRLKFLFAWLSKHQRRMISYSDDFYANVSKVLDLYLLAQENREIFSQLNDLYQEVWSKYSYIQQARKVRVLEDLTVRLYRGEHISYLRMLTESVTIMHGLKFEIVSYFDTLVNSIIHSGEKMLNDRYLLRTYINKTESELTANGLEIRKNYRKLVALVDEFYAIRRAREISHN